VTIDKQFAAAVRRHRLAFPLLRGIKRTTGAAASSSGALAKHMLKFSIQEIFGFNRWESVKALIHVLNGLIFIIGNCVITQS